MDPLKIISLLNEVVGSHGFGRIDHIENRVVGLKSREVYEAPAALTLIEAHKDLEKLVGVVTVRDIAYIYGPYHLYYVRRIRSSNSIEELSKVYRDFVERVRRDASKFIDPQEIPDPITFTRMTTTVYRTLIERVASIAAKKLNISPDKAAYLVLGSGGRYEQFLVTDRDTMLIYAELSESRAREFAEMVEDMLDKIGFPGCEKGYTAKKLLYSLEEIDSEIGKLIRSIGQNEESIILLSLLFDADTVWGKEDFAKTVRETIAK
ncbi:MAG TPA: hypothetical protein EYP82_00555 [Hydrogenothermaceae bacterium]|nr:hypothetical protein [Hydrogenothermaceae bacterium]